MKHKGMPVRSLTDEQRAVEAAIADAIFRKLTTDEAIRLIQLAKEQRTFPPHSI